MNKQPEKKVTIAQVAKLCEVSKTTISRYLNGKYENISEQTRERIRRVIAELDYRPNRSAQRLKARRTMLIGCVIADVSTPFSALVLKGITGVCEAAGYQVLFADSGEEPVRERGAIEGFLENRVDGLIVNATGGNDEFLISIQRRGIPVALADRGLSQEGLIDTAASTNEETAYRCVEFLLGCGYERVAFFTEGNRRITPRILRNKGYDRAVRALCPPGVEPQTYVFDRESEQSCLDCLRAFRSAHPGRRIAILSVNGVTAQHILLALRRTELELGRDYGLCTFDDWTWLRLAPPGVTSVSLGSELIGAKAAQMLLERIDGKRPPDAPAAYVEIPAKLMVRGSTLS